MLGLVSHRGTQSRLIGFVFVRYVFQEDILRVLLLPTNASAAELFESLNDSLSGKLNWLLCVGVCRERGLFGFTPRVKEVISEC